MNAIITLNYLVALTFGILFFCTDYQFQKNRVFSWIPFAVIIGTLFIAVFYLIGNSSQKAGVTVTTIANKLSLVFPVFFSIFWFNEKLDVINYLGLFLALVAIFLTLFKKEKRKRNVVYILLPLAIFAGSGVADSVIKYAQAVKIEQDDVPVFTTAVFFVAFCCGLVVYVAKKTRTIPVHTPTIVLGVLLGFANFGSLFFIFTALNKSNLESSLVFSINNISVVLLSAIIGWSFFNERLHKLNYAGIVLAVISMYFLLK